MLVPVFTLKLNQKLIPRLVTVGKYDGKHSCLTAATNGNKVFIHNPHQKGLPTLAGGGRLTASLSDSDISFLNIGQHVTALGVGSLVGGATDALLVGSQTNLLAYNVDRNSELFYKEVPDGVNAITVGCLGNRPSPLVFVGGNCSIQGFDQHGEDHFWTVTGDNVCSLSLCPFNVEGGNELLVGSEDYDIRVFQDDELIAEISEADAVTCLCPIEAERFGFALANGIVGAYRRDQRFWRIKSKNQPICLHSYDANEDGVPELVTGWSNGKIDVRDSRSGEVIFKDIFSSHIAGIVQADYRMDGKEELICCTVDGEVRGYLPAGQGDSSRADVGSCVAELEMLQDLSAKKQIILQQLKNFEVNEKVAREPQAQGVGLEGVSMAPIPISTSLRTDLTIVMPNPKSKLTPHVELAIKSSNGVGVRALMIFAEGLFDGESHVVHRAPQKVTDELKVPLFPDKDIATDLNIKAVVGHSRSKQCHVFEMTRLLPQFSLYLPCKLPSPSSSPSPSPSSETPHPLGRVEFQLNEKREAVLKWIGDCFLYPPGEDCVLKPDYLHIAYMSLRTNTPLVIKIDNGKAAIETDDMDLAGDVIQSLTQRLCISNLRSTADFPKQLQDLRSILDKVNELHSARQKLSSEMADNSGIIKNLVLRAEDARMMNDMRSMRKGFMQLYELNRDIIMGYRIRSNNHLELLECLRIVNQAIQKAGRLRVGKPKTEMVSACRNALKEKNTELLIKAIETGS